MRNLYREPETKKLQEKSLDFCCHNSANDFYKNNNYMMKLNKTKKASRTRLADRHWNEFSFLNDFQGRTAVNTVLRRFFCFILGIY